MFYRLQTRGHKYWDSAWSLWQVPGRTIGAVSVDALTGVTSITFGAAGVATSTTQVTGTASLVFGAVGDVSQTNQISGSASIIFDAQGDLTETSSLSGTSGIVFGATADWSALVALTGTSSLTFSGTASLTDATKDDTVNLTAGVSAGIYILEPKTGEWIHTQIMFTNEPVGPQG